MRCPCGNPAVYEIKRRKKVFYLCADCNLKDEQANAISMHNNLTLINALHGQMEMVTGIRMPRVAVPALPHFLTANMNTNNVNVSNSTVGVINTGTIENIQNALTQMQGTDAKDIASDIYMLANLVREDAELEIATRNEILERIEIIAEEAAKPKPSRRLSAVRAAIGDASTLVGAANTLATLWDRYSTKIMQFFGIA